MYTDIASVEKYGTLTGYQINTDTEAIKNSIRNIFTIQKGTMPGYPNFGNPLEIAVFDLFDYYHQQHLSAAVKSAIQIWEPRVTVHTVEIFSQPERNTLLINISFSYNIGNDINLETLSIPYSHNSVTYLGGRIRPQIPTEAPNVCK